MNHAQVIWAALLLAQVVVVSPIAFYLFSRNRTMPDFTALQSSISTLSTVTGELSTQIANSTDAAVQAQIDGVTSSLAPLVSTLSGLVSAPSVVSTTEGQ